MCKLSYCKCSSKNQEFWLIYVRLLFFLTGKEIDMYKSTIAPDQLEKNGSHLSSLYNQWKSTPSSRTVEPSMTRESICLSNFFRLRASNSLNPAICNKWENLKGTMIKTSLVRVEETVDALFNLILVGPGPL